MTIREYQDSDEPAVIVIARQLQKHESSFYDRLIPPGDIGTEYVERLKADVRAHGGRFLVAEADGRIVGYATLLTNVTSEGERDEVLYSFSNIDDLAVLESHRNHGIGRKLVTACEKIARDAGQRWIRLGVLAKNEGARRFYSHLGFEELGLWLEKPIA